MTERTPPEGAGPVRTAPGWLSWVEGLSPRATWGVATLLLASIALADAVTSVELSFEMFYALPVGLAAWKLGRKAGILFGVVSMVILIGLGFFYGHPFSRPAFLLWQAGAAGAFYGFLGETMRELRLSLDREHLAARTDPVTGLANRRAFLEALTAERLRSERYGHPLTVAILDGDGFKQVNDRLGHAAGDAVLRDIGESLARDLRAPDVAARFGGDEFAVLLVETGPEHARTVLERLRTSAHAELVRRGVQVTLSGGAVTFLAPLPSDDETLAEADRLLYRAKAAGKDRLEHGTIGSHGRTA
jgi:diguanylate cyclase (GGDEF)-like protein